MTVEAPGEYEIAPMRPGKYRVCARPAGSGAPGQPAEETRTLTLRDAAATRVRFAFWGRPYESAIACGGAFISNACAPRA